MISFRYVTVLQRIFSCFLKNAEIMWKCSWISFSELSALRIWNFLVFQYKYNHSVAMQCSKAPYRSALKSMLRIVVLMQYYWKFGFNKGQQLWCHYWIPSTWIYIQMQNASNNLYKLISFRTSGSITKNTRFLNLFIVAT